MGAGLEGLEGRVFLDELGGVVPDLGGLLPFTGGVDGLVAELEEGVEVEVGVVVEVALLGADLVDALGEVPAGKEGGLAVAVGAGEAVDGGFALGDVPELAGVRAAPEEEVPEELLVVPAATESLLEGRHSSPPVARARISSDSSGVHPR